MYSLLLYIDQLNHLNQYIVLMKHVFGVMKLIQVVIDCLKSNHICNRLTAREKKYVLL